MFKKFKDFRLKRALRLVDAETQAVYDARKEDADGIYEIIIAEARKEAAKTARLAAEQAQKKVNEAMKFSNTLAIKMYEKDIYSRQFLRLAPMMDPDGFERLKSGKGGMKCKLILPDGTKQVVELIKYDA